MFPIRVLHIVTYMGRGGLETMLMNYYRHIDRSKIQFDFLVHRDFKADYDDEVLSLGGQIFHIQPLNPFLLSYYKALEHFFSEHSYQIVHSHLDCMSAYPLSVAKKCGVPIRIAHAHSASQDKNIKYPLKLFSKKIIPCFATNLFACGKAAGEWMFPHKHFSIIHNAINTNDYLYDHDIRTASRRELKISDEQLLIGHVGRFAPPKNHTFLLDIFYEVKKRRPDAILVLVGTGDLQESIKNKAKQLGLIDDILFLNNRTDVNRILQAFDVFVMPSLYEGVSVATIEAQAASLPCVFSDTVSDECKITDNVEFISLSKSPEIWAQHILNYTNATRSNQFDAVKNSGYDITENARWLENFYLNKVKNHG